MESETKQCPYCGKEIKAAAKKCRYCGEWLEDSKSTQSEQQSGAISGEDTHNIVTPDTIESEDGISEPHLNKIGCIIVVSLIVIGAICFFFINSNSSHSSDDYSCSDTIVAEENSNTEYTYITESDEAETVEGNTDYAESLSDADLATIRYKRFYSDAEEAGFRIFWGNGKKIWVYVAENDGTKKMGVFDSETRDLSFQNINKTSMDDEYMNIDDTVVRNGVITFIMSEMRNSNGWVEGTYVWQYNCNTGAWKCLAKACSGAEFTNNRTSVKIDNAECLNPDDFTYLQEYRHNYRTVKL